MRYVDYWVHVEKTPVPQRIIMQEMSNRGISVNTVIKSLGSLIKLGYIRKAITNGQGEDGIGAEKTKYVQLRRL